MCVCACVRVCVLCPVRDIWFFRDTITDFILKRNVSTVGGAFFTAVTVRSPHRLEEPMQMPMCSSAFGKATARTVCKPMMSGRVWKPFLHNKSRDAGQEALCAGAALLCLSGPVLLWGLPIKRRRSVEGCEWDVYRSPGMLRWRWRACWKSTPAQGVTHTSGDRVLPHG